MFTIITSLWLPVTHTANNDCLHCQCQCFAHHLFQELGSLAADLKDTQLIQIQQESELCLLCDFGLSTSNAGQEHKYAVLWIWLILLRLFWKAWIIDMCFLFVCFIFCLYCFCYFFPPHLVWECLLQKNKQVNAKMHKCDSSSIWLISDFSDLTGKNVCLWNGQCLAVWPVGWSKNPDSWIVWTL